MEQRSDSLYPSAPFKKNDLKQKLDKNMFTVLIITLTTLKK